MIVILSILFIFILFQIILLFHKIYKILEFRKRCTSNSIQPFNHNSRIHTLIKILWNLLIYHPKYLFLKGPVFISAICLLYDILKPEYNIGGYNTIQLLIYLDCNHRHSASKIMTLLSELTLSKNFDHFRDIDDRLFLITIRECVET